MADFPAQIVATARSAAHDAVRALAPTTRWATVTGASPLRIRFDGATDPLATKPSTLIGGLMVGERVYVIQHQRRVVIIGRVDDGSTTIDLAPLFVAGTPATSPTLHVGADGWCQITGAWQMAGSPAVPYMTNATLLTIPAPYRPAATVVASATPFGSAVLITAGCRVLSTGVLEVYVNNSATGGTTTAHFPLTGLRWRIGGSYPIG